MPDAGPCETGSKPSRAKANWFSDLRLTRHGIIVKKTGQKIGLAEITPSELYKFCLYFAVVLGKGWHVRLFRPSGLAVWFAPDRPRPWYILWSAMTLAGVRFAPVASKADVAFYFEDVTSGEPLPSCGKTILNAACSDISKSRVSRIFEDVAGYPLGLDPERHQGKAVEKSERNGLHDGRIVTCPRPRIAGKSYQRFVDSSDCVTAYDFRTTVIGRIPRFVLVKTKPVSRRFSIHNDTVCYREVGDVFSSDEIDLITRFAREMRLDWAALDILRDAGTGHIYIVDVNKTDTGPAVDLSWHDRACVMDQISRHFLTMIEDAAQPSASPAPAQAARSASGGL